MRIMCVSSAGTPQLVQISRQTGTRLAAIVTALVIVIADRISKLLILKWMNPFDSIPIIPGWLRIVHAENPGAAFGVLADGSALVRSIVLIGISTLVLVFVGSALWSRNGALRSWATRCGLALILGGAIGNLLDRVFRGTVTDFVEVYHGSWSFPAFNIADSAITVGAVLLLFDIVKPHGKSIKREAAQQ